MGLLEGICQVGDSDRLGDPKERLRACVVRPAGQTARRINIYNIMVAEYSANNKVS